MRNKLSTQLTFEVDSTTTANLFALVGRGAISDGASINAADSYYLEGVSFRAIDNVNSGGVVIHDTDDSIVVHFGAGGADLLPGHPNILKVEFPLLSGTMRYALTATNYDFDDQDAVANTGPYIGTIPGLSAAVAAAVADVANVDDLFDIIFIAGHDTGNRDVDGKQDTGVNPVGTPEPADTGLSCANPIDDSSGADDKNLEFEIPPISNIATDWVITTGSPANPDVGLLTLNGDNLDHTTAADAFNFTLTVSGANGDGLPVLVNGATVLTHPAFSTTMTATELCQYIRDHNAIDGIVLGIGAAPGTLTFQVRNDTAGTIVATNL